MAQDQFSHLPFREQLAARNAHGTMVRNQKAAAKNAKSDQDWENIMNWFHALGKKTRIAVCALIVVGVGGFVGLIAVDGKGNETDHSPSKSITDAKDNDAYMACLQDDKAFGVCDYWLE